MPGGVVTVGSQVAASEVAADVATQAELDAAIASIRTALIAPTPGVWAHAAGGVVANRATLARFVPPRNFNAAVIAFVVTTAAAADDACDVGIYDTALTRLVSSGATTGKLNSTGVKTITITSTPLTAGTPYFAAFSSGAAGGSAVAVSRAQYTSGDLTRILGTGATEVEVHHQETAHPLPNPLVSLGSIGVVPLLAVRES